MPIRYDAAISFLGMLYKFALKQNLSTPGFCSEELHWAKVLGWRTAERCSEIKLQYCALDEEKAMVWPTGVI